MDLAARLLAPRTNEAAHLPDELVNPFNPEVVAAKNAQNQKSQHQAGSDREVLAKIAAGITPSGMMMLRGEPLLLFREKKLRVGDDLKVSFQGSDYVVVITAIDSASFRLRLNREELTRPIKK